MNFKIGDEVIFINQEKHDIHPGWYPKCGTKGTVIGIYRMGILFIQWEKGSTSGEDKWSCCADEVETIEQKGGKMMSNGLEIAEYNLEYMGVKCTGVIWGFWGIKDIFFFEKDGEKYRFETTVCIESCADTDHIRSVIKYLFLPWIEKRKNKKLKHMIKVHNRALEMVCEVLKTEEIDGEYYMEVIERWKNEKGKDCQSFDYFIERAEKEEEKTGRSKK